MINKKVKILFIALFVSVLIFFLIEKSFLPGGSSKTSPYKSFKLLGTVIGLVKSEYIVKVNPAKTMKGALKGMVDSLDILSSYLNKETVAKYLKLNTTRFNDIGVILAKIHSSFPVVVGIIENSPAQDKGFIIGDTISRIDGLSTLTMSLTEINLHLKSSAKKPVKLKIMRDVEEPEIIVDRKLLFEKPYSISSLAGTNGILTINHLYDPCLKMIKKEVIPTIKSQQETLIIDLRNCHEGDINEAIGFINLFMTAENIGYFEKHKGQKETISAPEKAKLENIPLVIWINQATIGPSEAIAAVLQEMRQAKIIGIPSPGWIGKQELFPLEDDSALLLTTGIFHPKSGKKLWEKGIKPDVKIEFKDNTYETYVKSTKKNLHSN